MRVTIVGAGVGGLAAALALAARGLRPTVLERADVLAEAGAGVQLGPNAVRVLDALGVGEAARAAAFRPQAVEVRRARDARLLLRAPLGEAAERRWGAPYLQLHRADLQALLLAAVRARDAAELRFGAVVEAAGADGGVRLAGGETLRADALVVADGVRSAARAAVADDDAAPRRTGQTAWRATVKTAALPAGLVPPVAGVWTAPRRHFVHYPVRGGALVNVVGVTERGGVQEEGWTQRGDPAAFAALFAGWPEPVASLVRAAGEVWTWALHDRPPARRMAAGRAALLGDAAHPMLPFLAQGAAMAIEDAWVLADSLAGGGAGAGDVEARLAAYAAARLPRVRRVQAASTRNARLFHLPDAAAGLAFGAAGAVDALRPGGAMARLDWLYGGGPVQRLAAETPVTGLSAA